MTDGLGAGGARRGRPPKDGVRASEFVRIRITEGQKNDLRNVAKSEKRSMADVTRDAIKSYVSYRLLGGASA